MDDRTQIEQVAQAIAAAIQARDDSALTPLLAPDFVLRRPGAAAVTAVDFIKGVREQPVELLSVRLEQIEIDLAGDAAIATGIQTSKLQIDSEPIEDRQPFVNWFVKYAGSWQLRAALDFSDW
jgi:ketosteroid isomerase-like protein